MAGRTETEILTPDPAGLSAAAAHLRMGKLVAFPTETVYGLGADARDGRAVAGIYEAKGRPRFNPLIVHVPALDAARGLAEFSDLALRLAAAFWPGPLTLVLPRRADAGLAELVGAGLPSVAIRVPAHRVALALLDAFGGVLAAPSANPSGRVSPTCAAHVLAGLSGRVAAVLDGGICPVGIESTVVSLTGPLPELLRPGGIPAEALRDAGLGPVEPVRPDAEIAAPGMLQSHYAPRAPLRLNATRPAKGELWLGFGAEMRGEGLNLSPAGDPVEAAASLFAHLHRLDAMLAERGGAGIAVAPIPAAGLGAAINDRLLRAAAPRPVPDPLPC